MKQFSINKRIESFRYAFHGIKMMVLTQHNLWIHLVLAAAAIIAGIIMNITILEWVAVFFAIGFVLAAEAFNTAVEFLVDMVSPESNPKAGLIKDIAAAGVLISALTAAAVGILVFLF